MCKTWTPKEIKFGDHLSFAGKIFVVKTFDHSAARSKETGEFVTILDITAEEFK